MGPCKGLLFIVPVILIILAGCRAEDDLDRLMKPDWRPDVSVPVVHTKLSIDEVLDSQNPGDFIEVGSDGLITLVYEDVLYSKTGNELLPLQNLILHFADSSGIASFISGGNYIDYIELLSGQLDIWLQQTGLNTRSNELYQVTVSIPSLMKDGIPFQQEYTIEYNGGKHLLDKLDLSGHRLEFTNENGIDNAVRMSVIVRDQFGKLTGNSFQQWLEFTNMAFSYVEGRFGDLDLGFKPDTIALHIFENWKKGTVVLDNPLINLSFSNSFGFPITGSLVLMEGYSAENGGVVVPLENTSNLEDGFVIEYPTVGDLLDIVESSFILDGNNSNLSNMLSISPSQLRFNFYFLAEGGASPEKTYFIRNESRLDFKLQVELPMQGKLQHILLQDTFKIDSEVRKVAAKSEKLELHLKTENFMPLDLGIQLMLIDDKGKFLDSLLLDPTILLSGKTNHEGRVTEAVHKTTRILLDSEQIASFGNTDRIVLQARVRTTSGGTEEISFYSNYYLGLDLGMAVKTQLN